MKVHENPKRESLLNEALSYLMNDMSTCLIMISVINLLFNPLVHYSQLITSLNGELFIN